VEINRSDELMENARNLGIDAVITIGGDGSLAIAQRLHECGLKIIGVPKTIDNDVSGTVTTFGFDTAVNTALEAIDKLHTTAESHDRVIVMEVMGRHAGFIALHSGLAGTADVILIPENRLRHWEGLREDHGARPRRPALLDRGRGGRRVRARRARSDHG
jgi:6-phosphofructokinase 1